MWRLWWLFDSPDRRAGYRQRSAVVTMRMGMPIFADVIYHRPPLHDARRSSVQYNLSAFPCKQVEAPYPPFRVPSRAGVPRDPHFFDTFEDGEAAHLIGVINPVVP